MLAVLLLMRTAAWTVVVVGTTRHVGRSEALKVFQAVLQCGFLRDLLCEFRGQRCRRLRTCWGARAQRFRGLIVVLLKTWWGEEGAAIGRRIAAPHQWQLLRIQSGRRNKPKRWRAAPFMLGLRVRGIGVTLFFDKKTKVLKQRQREDYSVVWNQNKKVSPAGAPQAGSAVERWAA